MRADPGHRSRIRRPIVILAAVVVLAAVGGGLLGWQLTQQSDTQSATLSRPYPATLPRASCGSAVTHQLARDTQILSAGRGALPCFGAAVRACRPASIEVVDMGVDTGTDYLFTVEPGGTRCLVYQQSQNYSANFGGLRGPITATSCYRTTADRNGVVLACGGQDVLIPATVTVRVP